VIRLLLSIACHEYGVAAVLYLAYLVRQWKSLPRIGRWLVGTGMVLHAVALALWLAQAKTGLSLAQGCAALTLLLLGIFFFLDLRYRIPVLGAFLLPLALAALVPGMLVNAQVPRSTSSMGPLLPVHVVVALAGLAAFAGAAAVGVMYLLQERQVKSKHFGILFSRLPSLQFLDHLNQTLVVWGFVALSITLVTGIFFVDGFGRFFWQWEPKEVATLIAWLLFGVLLNARLLVGWRGKRAAWLTMAGFCLLVVSFVSSFEVGHTPWGQ
jgi:ABC-type uncharacterized transport system permease subunit